LGSLSRRAFDSIFLAVKIFENVFLGLDIFIHGVTLLESAVAFLPDRKLVL